MMNKFLLGMTMVLTTSALQAGRVADNCGCGLGRMALGEETGLLSHVAATFLNVLSGNQTFGVTSGTLDCEQAVSLVSVREVETFVAGNMDHIAIEASVGEGSYLSALADLLKIEDASKREQFFLAMQINFEQIFPGAEVSAADVTRSIVKLI
jgi:hypothetical protein